MPLYDEPRIAAATDGQLRNRSIIPIGRRLTGLMRYIRSTGVGVVVGEHDT